MVVMQSFVVRSNCKFKNASFLRLLFYSLFELPFIFMLRRYSASYMSFTFVFLKDLFYAFEKLRRDFRQTFCQILMYCGFAYAKFLCRTAHRGSVRRNILSKQHTSFLFGSIHCSHPIKFFCSNLYAQAYLIITKLSFRLYKIIADNQIFLCKMLEIIQRVWYNKGVITRLSHKMNETRG